MKKVLMAAAAVLMLGANVAAAATNYVETPRGFFSYQAPGLGNANNQTGG